MNRKSIIRTLFLAVSVFSGVAMAQENKAKILVLIHSDNGGTYELAKEIESGIEKIIQQKL